MKASVEWGQCLAAAAAQLMENIRCEERIRTDDQTSRIAEHGRKEVEADGMTWRVQEAEEGLLRTERGKLHCAQHPSEGRGRSVA